jgi:hypothetical protein
MSYSVDAIQSQNIKSNSATESKQNKKSIVERIKDSFFNAIKRLKDLFVYLFNCVFHRNGLPAEIDFKQELEKLNLESEELVLKKSRDFPEFLSYFGIGLYDNSYNVFWKLWTCLSKKTNYEIGKEEVARIESTHDYKTLIPYLKDFYQSQISLSERRIKNS